LAKNNKEEEERLKRLRLPRRNEVFGIVEQRQGGSRMLVRCSDNKTRLARVPGKIKRRIWIKEGDVVIIKPWEVQGDEKGDIVWRYTITQVNRLQERGLLNFS